MRIGFFTDSYLPATHGVEISIYKEELKKIYPSNYLEGGAGRVIEI